MLRNSIALFFAAVLVPTASFAAKPSGKGPCTDASQCREGVCVEVNNNAYCSQTCGDCPAGMYCDANLFAVAGLKVCLRGSTRAPVEVKTPPRLPCKNDDQCEGALVCAEFMGHRDCALPCTQARQCEAPEMMGVKMDFLACQLDEGQRGRKACLPKKACLANPAACMSVDPGAMAGAMKGMVKMTEGLAGAMDDMDDDDDAPAPAMAPPPPVQVAMDAARFRKLLAQVKGAAFEDERQTVLSTAARRNWFNCAQLGQIVDVISFADEKVAAVRVIAPKLVDRENSHEVLGKFTFDDDRAEAAKILDR